VKPALPHPNCYNGIKDPTRLKGFTVPEAKNGDSVKVHYTGKLKDGTVFDSSADRDPLEFKLGEGRVIPGFEKAVLGMNAGEKKTAEIGANDGYGPHRDELVAEVNRSVLPQDLEVQVGQQLQMNQPDGKTIVVEVTDVKTDSVTLDANHPLAGKDLTFEIELVEIA
jgi:FKBP-type peptidyl-prolyl cis-trans isomerase 2